MARFEGPRHTVLIGSTRGFLVRAKSAGLIHKLAIFGLVVPLRTGKARKSHIVIGAKTAQSSAEPHMKKVHQVGIGYSIVIRWICNYRIKVSGRFGCARKANLGRWHASRGLACMLDGFGHPSYGAKISTSYLRKRIDLRIIPSNREDEFNKGSAQKLPSDCPSAKIASIIGNSVIGQGQVTGYSL